MSTSTVSRVAVTRNVPVGSPQRLLSLDVLRGLTIAGMILVTDPGTYGARYGVLAHAEWNNPTATDLGFPCFLVMVGVAGAVFWAAAAAECDTRRATAACNAA